MPGPQQPPDGHQLPNVVRRVVDDHEYGPQVRTPATAWYLRHQVQFGPHGDVAQTLAVAPHRAGVRQHPSGPRRHRERAQDGRAPSGANKQPWTFVAVSDPDVTRRIREAAEAEQRRFYGGRAPQDWLDALGPLGTDAHKPFLERAPWLIAVFAQTHAPRADGTIEKHYFVKESVGLATGFLLVALH